jgi:hypothetical protein
MKYIVFVLLSGMLVSSSPINKPLTTVFVGDSLTLGANATDYVGFASLVSKEGQRFAWYHLADALVRWDQVSAANPDAIVIELGVHAVVGCDHLVKRNGQQFEEWYGRVLDRALQDTDDVCIVNVPWLNWSREQAAWALWYNHKLAQLAADYGLSVADAWSATVNCGACISGDDFHLNDLGHRRLADVIMSDCFNKEIK